MIIAASILVGCLMAWAVFRIFFEDLADLVECIRYWLTPDIISAFRGEWRDDQWAELKLFVYVAVSVGSGVVTYFGLQKWFG